MLPGILEATFILKNVCVFKTKLCRILVLLMLFEISFQCSMKITLQIPVKYQGNWASWSVLALSPLLPLSCLRLLRHGGGTMTVLGNTVHVFQKCKKQSWSRGQPGLTLSQSTRPSIYFYGFAPHSFLPFFCKIEARLLLRPSHGTREMLTVL